MSMLSFSCTVLVTWEGILVSESYFSRELLLLLTSCSVCSQKASQSKVTKSASMDAKTLTSFSGGPAGLVYGFIVAWIGTSSIFITISELASLWVKR